jgi:hypothetical protein
VKGFEDDDRMLPSTARVDILLPLAVSLAVTFGTIVIHALALIAIVHFVRRERRLGHTGVRFWRDVTIVGTVAVLAFIAHLIEIAAWAVVFILCTEFTSFAPAFYHSAVNYTSLGCQRRLKVDPLWRESGMTPSNWTAK